MLDSTKEARLQLKTGGLEEIGADFADFQDNLIATSAFRKKSKKGAKVLKMKGETKLPEAVKDLLGKANYLYINRDYGQAIALLQETITKYPNLHQPWNTLGLVHEEMGNKEKALQVRMVAAHMSGNDAGLWKELGLRSIENNANQQAIYCFTKALVVDPLDVDALWDRSFLQKEMGLGLKAMEGFQQILTILPYHFKVINELAQIYRSQGETKKAIQLYEEAMEYHIKHQQDGLDDQQQHGAFSDTLGYSEINMLSELYLMLNDYRRALDCIKTGIRHVQKRQFQLRWLNRPDDDDEYLPKLKKKKKSEHQQVQEKGNVRRSKRNLKRNTTTTEKKKEEEDDEDRDHAKTSSSIIIDDDSDDSDVYDPNKLENQDDSSDSDEYHEEKNNEKEEEDDSDELEGLSNQDTENNSDEDSEEEQQDRERFNIPMELRVRMGVCRIYLGQPKVAGRHFNYLYQHKPNVYPDLYQDVACAYMDRRFYKLALPIFQKIIDAEDEVEVDLLVKTADCYRQTGELETAVLFYVNVLDEQPDNLEVMTSLALVYEQQGKEDEAFELANFVVEKTRELKKKKRLEALAAATANLNKDDQQAIDDGDMNERDKDHVHNNKNQEEEVEEDVDEMEEIEEEEYDMETGVSTTIITKKKKTLDTDQKTKKFASLFDESTKTMKSQRLILREKKRREEETKLFKAMDLYDAILNLEKDLDPQVVDTDVNVIHDYIYIAQQLWEDFSSIKSFYIPKRSKENKNAGFFAARKRLQENNFSSREAKSNLHQTEIHSDSDEDEDEDEDDDEEEVEGHVKNDIYNMTHFRNILIDEWIKIFITLAYMLTILYRGDEAVQMLKRITDLKMVCKNHKRMNATMLAFIGCSLILKDKRQAQLGGRWFCGQYIFKQEGYKIYNIVLPSGFEDKVRYASANEFKYFRRQVILMDKLYMLYQKHLISDAKDENGDIKISEETKEQIAKLYKDFKSLNANEEDEEEEDEDEEDEDNEKESLKHVKPVRIKREDDDDDDNEEDNDENDNDVNHSQDNEHITSLFHLMKNEHDENMDRMKPLANLDINLLANFGHINALAKNYGNSVTYYLRVYAIQPNIALNNLCLAVAYLQRSTQRTIGNRHFLVVKAMQMLADYCKLRKHNQESEYNMGRAFHTIGLTHLAVKHYEKALTLPSAAKEGIESPTSIDDVYLWPLSNDDEGEGEKEKEEHDDEEYDDTDLKYEAAYNLHLIYMTSGATSLAQLLLLKYCTI
ncbi:unnamed protein product [Cunninghamella blakesleeana]